MDIIEFCIYLEDIATYENFDEDVVQSFSKNKIRSLILLSWV